MRACVRSLARSLLPLPGADSLAVASGSWRRRLALDQPSYAGADLSFLVVASFDHDESQSERASERRQQSANFSTAQSGEESVGSADVGVAFAVTVVVVVRVVTFRRLSSFCIVERRELNDAECPSERTSGRTTQRTEERVLSVAELCVCVCVFVQPTSRPADQPRRGRITESNNKQQL